MLILNFLYTFMDDNSRRRPEWVPDEHHENKHFASEVMAGIKGGHDGIPGQTASEDTSRRNIKARKALTIDDYVQGVLSQNRSMLARTITLIESNHSEHMKMAQEVLKQLLPCTGKSLRVGITGVPGAGKSTFIEALGTELCQKGYKVAVLAVDPSSSVTGGSILGDKTRMEKLVREENAFIRPSPSGGSLGGVNRKSRETMLLCEAAGYDTILVETVGVGQNEVSVRSMVDFFLLILIAGAGDELQGIKKGVIEIADAIVVNKADGDNKIRANIARAEYERVLQFLAPATQGWKTRALTSSSLEPEAFWKIWETVLDFKENTVASNVFQNRRKKQSLEWMHSMIEEGIKNHFFRNPELQIKLKSLEKQITDGMLPPTSAAHKILADYFGEHEF